LVNHTAVIPAAITAQRLTKAIAITRILDLRIVRPPCLPVCRSSASSNRLLNLERHEFQVARRQAEALAVADRSVGVDEHDEAVVAVQQLIDELMDMADVAAERLSKRHDSELSRRSYVAEALRRGVAASRLGATAPVSRVRMLPARRGVGFATCGLLPARAQECEFVRPRPERRDRFGP
jgi:hypothetical protein